MTEHHRPTPPAELPQEFRQLPGHQQAASALANLQNSLPAGISAICCFNVKGNLGIFEGSTTLNGDHALTQALFLKNMLNDAERIALLLGAPEKGAENGFAGGRGQCLQYSPEAVQALIRGVRELFVTYGDVEMNRVQMGTVDVRAIAQAETTKELGELAAGVVHFANRSPLLQLLCRAGCIDENTRCEYPRLDVAEFMRSWASKAGPVTVNFGDSKLSFEPVWSLVQASANPPASDYVRSACRRDMTPTEVPHSI